MGKKDIYTNNYFEDNERFADLVNGALYGGRKIIRSDDLDEVNKELVYAKGQNTKKVIADNAKLWKKEKTVFALYSLENLSYIDYAIVIRCMTTEAFAYNKQLSTHAKRLRRRHDITGDEFLSDMASDDTFYPVIPIVVYYGTDKTWNAKTSLYELLDISDDSILKPYINNYKINFFNFHDHDSFNEFHTEVKTLFEFLRYSKDKEALHDIMDENADRYSHVDHETGELIKVLTGNKALEKYEGKENKKIENNITKTQKGGEWNMCQAFEDYRIEGETKVKISMLRKLYNKNMTAENVSNLFELNIKEVEEIYEFLESYPDENDSELAKRICDGNMALA